LKKQGILNSHISEILSRLGHTDTIVIADCGLPIPDETVRIDLSLKQGNPSFLETLTVILEDMEVEKITLAEEIAEQNPEVEKQTLSLLDKEVNKEYVTQEKFKE